MNTLQIKMSTRPKLNLLKKHSYASCYNRRLTKRKDYNFLTDDLENNSYKIPGNFFKMTKHGIENELFRIANGPYDSKDNKFITDKIHSLTLNNEKIWTREHERNPVDAPLLMRVVYVTICKILDLVYKDKPIQRFWFLETIARTPYFSYMSILHFYETLGWWRISLNLRQQHLNEEWNETIHLLVMENLGGDAYWIDRLIGRHCAIFYYLILNVFFLLSPDLSYKASELLEMHAYDTYMQFIDENEETLKTLPAMNIVIQYYRKSNYTNITEIKNLYDVFKQIADDEKYHALSMNNLTKID